jgi:hypothetical protein
LRGDELDAFVFDAVSLLVNLVVVGNDLVRQSQIPLLQGFDSAVYRFGYHVAHREYLLFDLL